MWRNRAMRHLVIGAMMKGIGGYGLVSWMPSFLIRTHDLSAAQVGLLLGVGLGVIGGLGAFLGGYLNDRLSKRRAGAGLAVIAVITAAVYPFSVGAYLVPELWLCGALLVFQIFGGGMYLAPSFALVQSLARLRMRSVAAAVKMLAINLIGLGTRALGGGGAERRAPPGVRGRLAAHRHADRRRVRGVGRAALLPEQPTPGGGARRGAARLTMVRLSDLPEHERAHLLDKNLGPLGPPAWVPPGKPLAERRVALVTTAGLHRRADAAFELTDASYRVLPGELQGSDLVMSHSSVNFDRSGFAEDVNLVFPIDRFRELADEGAIGGLASNHFSFMGAGLLPEAYEAPARDLARILHRDGVDTAFLTPV